MRPIKAHQIGNVGLTRPEGLWSVDKRSGLESLLNLPVFFIGSFLMVELARILLNSRRFDAHTFNRAADPSLLSERDDA
jgi:hypothetical protein